MVRRLGAATRNEAARRGEYDTVEAQQQRQSELGAQRYERFVQGESEEIYAPWENPETAEALGQLSTGTGQAATGFGRRAFGIDRRQWDPDVPYPQIEPTNTTDEERPRTIAMGYDPANNIVRVTFRPDHSGTSAVYEYYGVPDHVYDAFSSGPSPGRFIDDFLNGYSYTRRRELET